MMRWLILALIFVARITLGLQFQSIAPAAPLLIADLAISYAQLGLLIGLYFLPGVIISLPGGMLGQRFGNRQVMLWALGFMAGGGLATAASHSFWLAAAGRIVSGVGGVLLTVIASKITAEWFADREISTAMAVMLAGFPLGIGLGVAFFGTAASIFSWRSVQYFTVASTALAFLLFALLYRDPAAPTAATGPLRFWPNLPAREWRLSLAAGAAWMLFNVGFIVFLSFGPGVLVSQGSSLAQAGHMLSVAVWMSLVSMPIGGAIVDRTGRPDFAVVLGCSVTALALSAVPLQSSVALWLLIAGVMAGLPPGAIVALLPKGVNADYLAGALGIFYAVNYLGLAVTPSIAGLFRDLTESSTAPVYLSAGMMASTILAVHAFRWTERRTCSQPVK